MAYNEMLAVRIREVLANISNVEEQEKMRGISFMVDGKMCVRAHADGGMMLRCDPDMTDEFLTREGVSRFEMKGKPMMKGWLVISPEILVRKKEFDYWMKVALDYNKQAKAAPKRKK